MDEKDKLTPEELAAEQAQAQPPKEDEVRSQIISEFGFDPENDKERIDKLVTKEMKSRTDLSKAIATKIKYRNERDALKPKEVIPPPAATPTTAAAKPVDEIVNETLDKRALDDADYPDDLKRSIKRVMEIDGKGFKAALRDPYIAGLIETHTKQVRANNAAIQPNGNNTGGSVSGFSKDAPPAIDFSTPEAFEASSKKFDAWKAWMIKEGN